MSSRTAQASWQALGSTAVLRVEDRASLEEATALVKESLAAFDEACSRFREDSELSRVNREAGRPVAVGPMLIEALQLARRGAELTEGALDPTIGIPLERAGYDRSWELLVAAPDRPAAATPPQDPPRVTARRRGGWRELAIDPVHGVVRIPAGVKLDLGATAKALAADRAAAAVHEQLGCGVLVAIGGDLATAGTPPDGGWQIHVTDDHRAGADAPGQRITIASGGLATSSTVVRRWRVGGRELHHIIDPATGEPVLSRWRTVSVAAADCADANIASTTALLRGAEAPDWLAGLGLPARLVEVSGRVRVVAGWPRESGEPLPGAMEVSA
jgi:thiamine biosynthesis lipoprotein